MNEEEFFNRAINRICKDYDYNFANEFKLLFLKKDKEIERLKNIIKEVREIFKDYGDKEDIVGYTMYNITGEMLIALLEILDKTN